MARMTVGLDPELLAQAMELSGSRTKAAVIRWALEEYVRTRIRRSLIQAIEDGDLGIDLTIDELRRMRGCGN
jgi:Arc/MetJ family transcription regulator